jgi:hypothetical protein
MKRLLLRRVRVGDIKALKSFLVAVPDAVDVERYNTEVVWCGTFSRSITATHYE